MLHKPELVSEPKVSPGAEAVPFAKYKTPSTSKSFWKYPSPVEATVGVPALPTCSPAKGALNPIPTLPSFKIVNWPALLPI